MLVSLHAARSRQPSLSQSKNASHITAIGLPVHLGGSIRCARELGARGYVPQPGSAFGADRWRSGSRSSLPLGAPSLSSTWRTLPGWGNDGAGSSVRASALDRPAQATPAGGRCRRVALNPSGRGTGETRCRGVENVPARAVPCALSDLAGEGVRPPARRDQGDGEGDRGPHVRGRLDTDGAVVIVDDLLDDGQAEARALDRHRRRRR